MIARDVNVRVLPCSPAFSRLLPPSLVFARPIFKSLYIETAIPRNESYIHKDLRSLPLYRSSPKHQGLATLVTYFI